MRILFLTQVLPYPLDAGPKIRAYYVLRHLAERHEVTLLSFVRGSEKPEHIEHLRGFCREVHTVLMHRTKARDAWHLLRSLTRDIPFLIARDWVPEMADRLSHIAYRNPPFDAVHADQLWMAQYALGAKSPTCSEQSRRIPNPQSPIPKLVLDQHNAVYLIPQRLAQQERNPFKRLLLDLEWHKLARYEAAVCQQFDHVVWVTEEDRQALMGQIRNPQPVVSKVEPSAIRNSVIPICLDPDEHPLIPRRPDAHRVTFLGGMHWPPNAEGVLWFARHVWPLVQQQIPHAVLTIIGKNPPPELTPHVLRFTLHASRFTNCEVTGYVDDPTPYLADSAVFIVPLWAGGGMRVKILDAWARGIPIVSTTIGCEGIEVRDGENILVADTPQNFAQAVVRVIRDMELAQHLAENGRRWVEERYDWRTVYHAWDTVYA